MSAASVGTIVALSRGRWDEVVRMRQGVSLQGACSAETVLTSSAPSETSSVVTVSVAATALRDLRIDGAARLGLSVRGAGAELGADGVIVAGVRRAGVLVEDGARLTASRLAVHDTRSQESDRALGSGLVVERGARADVARGLFERNRHVAILAGGVGTSLRLEDVVVRDTLSQESDPAFGIGLVVESAASVDLARALVERNRAVAVLVLGADSRVTLDDVVVRDTLSQESDRTSGRGLQMSNGASVRVARALFERNRNAAIIAAGIGTSLRLEDVVVRDTLAQESDGALGRGLEVQGGASADVARALFERNREVAVLALGADSSVTLDDVVVRDTLSRESDRALGHGLEVQGGAIADVARALFERNREIAVLVSGADSSVTLDDVVVRDTVSQESNGKSGEGLGAQRGATAQALRVVVERSREARARSAVGSLSARGRASSA